MESRERWTGRRGAPHRIEGEAKSRPGASVPRADALDGRACVAHPTFFLPHLNHSRQGH